MSGEAVVARVSGRIVEAHVKEGDRVQAGQLMVKLDTSRIENAIAELKTKIKTDEDELGWLEHLLDVLDQQETVSLEKIKTEIREAELELRHAQRKVEEMRTLVPNLEPEQKLTLAEEDRERAEAHLNTIRSQEAVVYKEYGAKRSDQKLRIDSKRGSIAAQRESLKNLHLDREGCEIRAHVSGIVTQGHPREGDYVDAGKGVVAIAQETGLRVDVAVPAAELGSVKVGMKAKVMIDAYDYRDYGSIEGMVYEITPDSQLQETVGGRVPIYIVRIRMDTCELAKGARRGEVKLGMMAQVEIVIGAERITTLLFRKVREKVSLW